MSAIFTMAAKTRHKIWAVKIQHFPISSKFDMWVDNNVPNWFPTLKNFYRSPFSKWLPQYRNNSTLSDRPKKKICVFTVTRPTLIFAIGIGSHGVGWCPLLLCNGNSNYYYCSPPFFLWYMNVSRADLGNYWTEFHETCGVIDICF